MSRKKVVIIAIALGLALTMCCNTTEGLAYGIAGGVLTIGVAIVVARLCRPRAKKAVESLRAAILAAEPKIPHPAPFICISELQMACVMLSIAESKLAHAEWLYALHSAQMGMTNVNNCVRECARFTSHGTGTADF